MVLSEKLKNHEIKKTYLALVRGCVKENEATIHMPIARSTKDRKKMAVAKEGKDAITHFKVLERFEGYTFLEIKIETGRTHQIRVHFSYIGHPIVGDTLYGIDTHTAPFIQRQALHAYKVSFFHPITKKQMDFCSPIPEDIKQLISSLTKS